MSTEEDVSQKTQITETALFQRINRKLAHTHEAVRRQRESYDRQAAWYFRWRELGRFYVVDLSCNVITSFDIDTPTRSKNGLPGKQSWL